MPVGVVDVADVVEVSAADRVTAVDNFEVKSAVTVEVASDLTGSSC